MRRHIRAFCSTSRIVRDKDFAKWESEPWTQMWLPFLAIEHFPALLLDELWVSFGVGAHFRQIAIHEIVKNVNEKAMMFLHAINECDTVSSFLGCGKKSAWLAWSSCPSVTDAFLDISLQPVDLSSKTL